MIHRPAALALLLLACAAPAAAQEAEAILDRAAVCAPAPDPAAIAARAAERGWTPLGRREALRLQAISNDATALQGWAVAAGPGLPAYLLVETTQGGGLRPVTCEIVFQALDPAAVRTALERAGLSGAPLGGKRLEGSLPAGGTYVEWTAPEDSGWRTLSLSIPAPPRRGPALNRLRLSGVQR